MTNYLTCSIHQGFVTFAAFGHQVAIKVLWLMGSSRAVHLHIRSTFWHFEQLHRTFFSFYLNPKVFFNKRRLFPASVRSSSQPWLTDCSQSNCNTSSCPFKSCFFPIRKKLPLKVLLVFDQWTDLTKPPVITALIWQTPITKQIFEKSQTHVKFHMLHMVSPVALLCHPDSALNL